MLDETDEDGGSDSYSSLLRHGKRSNIHLCASVGVSVQ